MPIATIMPEYKSSVLLTAEENEQIFSLLGPRCQTLATTVVELYATSGRDNDEWHRLETGVLCLVKDNSRRSYFFRLFCPLRKQLLWEHEVYNNLQYLALTPYLHSFEAEDCITGFNFANEDEGAQLQNVLLQKLEYKKQRRLEKKQRSQNNLLNNTTVGQGHHRIAPQPNGAPSLGGSSSSLYNQSSARASSAISKKEGKKRLTKADIGKPQNFRHISHVGWDPNKGFDFDKVEDPQLKQFFEDAGVSENHLRDRDTREFIYDFINKHGGIEAVKEAVEPPPVPVRARPPPPPPNRAPPMAPPQPPPPPPPIRTLPPRNMPGTTTPITISTEAPPPPPPIPSCPLPPSVVQLPEDNNRSALLQEIRSGTTLRPVIAVSAESKRSSTASSRGELLDQIRQGVELKPVNMASSQQNQSNPPPQNSLAGALARALAERSRDIHGDSSGSSDDDDEEDDEEWED
uniref:Putative actin regulatory protein n=1 Tax=Panstrongylus megistus TaxID=65343 RepID=A0A069DUK1_9HEMI